MAGSVVQLQDYRQQAAPQQAQPAPVELVTLDTRKKWFQDSQDLTENARKLSEQDRDYRDHKQWTAFELNTLRKRGQPPIVKNRIARKVDTILGIAERAASDPKGYPRTPQDEQSAEVCTDTLRFICDQNRYPRIKTLMLENIVVEGTGGAEVIVEERNGQPEIIINRVRWEEIFADPYSREADYSDARYKGCAKWMNIDDVGALWGDEAKKMAEGSLNTSTLATGSFEDRPRSMSAMTDMRGKRVVVVDMYCRHGDTWHRYVFCSGGDLIPGGESPYLDEFEKPTCPIELQSLYVNRENERYGLVRGMLGPQDEINFRSSKILHLSSTRQTFGNKMSGLDVDNVKREMSRPDGHIEMETGEFGKDFGVIPTNDMMSGQVELLQEAKQEIDLYGPNNSLQGRGNDTQSGKAWQAQQQAGLAEVSPIFAAASDLDLRIYKQAWMRARQYWTAQRYVRVTDDENAFKFINVNEPVVDDMGNPVMDPRTGQPAVRNRPSEMNVDIIVDQSPDTINSAQEQQELLVRLREAGEPIPATAILMSSNLRNKKQIVDMIEKASQQGPNPEIEKLKIEMAKLQQTQATSQAKAALDQASAQKTQVETQILMHGEPSDNSAAQADIQLNRDKAAAEIGLKRETAAEIIALNREKANADMALKTQTAEQSARIAAFTAHQNAAIRREQANNRPSPQN